MGMPRFLAELRTKVGNDLMLLPGVSAIVTSGDTLLVMRRADDGRWAIPSGILEPDEDPATAIVREVREETSMIVRPVEVAAVVGRIRVTHVNGDVSEYVSTTFRCEIVSGSPRPGDDEALEAAFKPFDSPEVAEAVGRYGITLADFLAPGTYFAGPDVSV